MSAKKRITFDVLIEIPKGAEINMNTILRYIKFDLTECCFLR